MPECQRKAPEWCGGTWRTCALLDILRCCLSSIASLTNMVLKVIQNANQKIYMENIMDMMLVEKQAQNMCARQLPHVSTHGQC